MRFGKYTFNQADLLKTVEWSLVSAVAGFLTYFGANIVGVDSVWGPLLSTAAVAAATALQRLLTPVVPVPTPVVPVPTPVVPVPTPVVPVPTPVVPVPTPVVPVPTPVVPGPLPSPGSIPGPAILDVKF